MQFIVWWLILVILHSAVRICLFPLYFDLTPREKVEKGYLSWTENFNYNHSVIIVNNGVAMYNRTIYYYRKDILLLGLCRAVFKMNLTKEEELKKLNSLISDVNALDPSWFHSAKKKRKLIT